jgi:hypothetical protein
MPWAQETVVRCWCPLGDECGKKNKYFSDAENREAAEQQLAHHLRSQPAHVESDLDAGSIADMVSTANYCRFKKDVYFRSPPRSMNVDSGSDASNRGRGREHARSRDRARSRSRSRTRRQRAMEDMSFQLQAIKQHGHSQAMSTTKHEDSVSGSLPSIRIGGRSGMHMLCESAGSSIGNSSPMFTVDIKLFDSAMEYN